MSAGGAGGAGTAAGASEAAEAADAAKGAAMMPVWFLSHGGGPCFFMDDSGMFAEMGRSSKGAKFLKSLGSTLPAKPKAVLVISAHWEEAGGVAVYKMAKNKLLFDYYGFPPETYDIEWPVPGAPATADRVRAVLREAGISCGVESKRGLDHGSFVPLKLVFPEADVPVLQLSLDRGLDATFHYELGQALAPLRREGVLIVGSGFLTHNMGAFGPPGSPVATWAVDFTDWAVDAMTNKEYSPAKRKEVITKVADVPTFRKAHPREEHLLPLFVAAGAAQGAPGEATFKQFVNGGGSLTNFAWTA